MRRTEGDCEKPDSVVLLCGVWGRGYIVDQGRGRGMLSGQWREGKWDADDSEY